jgi:hypothetical protein
MFDASNVQVTLRIEGNNAEANAASTSLGRFRTTDCQIRWLRRMRTGLENRCTGRHNRHLRSILAAEGRQLPVSDLLFGIPPRDCKTSALFILDVKTSEAKEFKTGCMNQWRDVRSYGRRRASVKKRIHANRQPGLTDLVGITLEIQCEPPEGSAEKSAATSKRLAAR